MEWIERLEPSDGPWTRQELQDRHATQPAVIGEAVRELGQGPAAWAVETAARIVARLRALDTEVVPRGSTGHELEGCENGLLTALIMLHRGHFDRELVRRKEMLAVARNAFRQGMPLETLTHKIWASHTASQDELLAALERLVPAENHMKMIQRMNQVMFPYGNAFVSVLSEAYEEERRAWRGRLPEDRVRILLDVAAGGEPPADAEEMLGARLHGGHLHALVWNGVGGYVDDRDSKVDEWAFTVAEKLGARRMVSFQQDGMAQLWWSFPGDPPADAGTRVRAIERPAWLRVALGPAASGLDGFRQSHHGAAVAARVGRAAASGEFWEYDDVALLGLAVADRPQAARFARRVLGGLLEPGDRFAELRETVRLYLAEGNSRVAVARALHVAPTTVAYRVAQASDIIGGAVSSRPLEVQLALELTHHFPDLVAPEGG
ncbi:helix-turn-helix domain-containing protein [Microbacterium sp. NPDC096154]|uniref:helix-turn-helix domain-containing protein n=1 Tax=Microbacterium sp. NPDC096154 TaxID=3155549 RepID=UPI0033331EDC